MVGGILVYRRKHIPSKITLIEKENYIVALSKFIDYHTRLSCIFEAALFDFQVMNFSLVWKAFKKFRTRVMTTIKSFRMKCSRSSCQRCFLKKRLQHRSFPVSITKFLRTSILKNICERLLLVFRGNLMWDGEQCLRCLRYLKIFKFILKRNKMNPTTNR